MANQDNNKIEEKKLFISRDRFGTRITRNKPQWSGEYFIRQPKNEMSVPNGLHSLKIGECFEIVSFHYKLEGENG